MPLSTDDKVRKNTPLCTGVLDYFPLALAAVARLSKKGNDKHNKGQPLHWSRNKSTDHADCLLRHQVDRGTVDPGTGELHDIEVAWRALAQAQLAEEARLEAANTTVVVDEKEPEGYVSKRHTLPTISCDWSTPDVIRAADLKGTVLGRDPKTDRLADVTKSEAAPPPEIVQAKPRTTFWYLATPYTKFPAGHVAAYNLACKLTALLVLKGVPVFSPIAHSHSIADWLAQKHRIDFDLWMRVDAPFMEAASGLIVVTAESWQVSRGMAEEISRFQNMGKRIVEWNPANSVPHELFL